LSVNESTSVISVNIIKKIISVNIIKKIHYLSTVSLVSIIYFIMITYMHVLIIVLRREVCLAGIYVHPDANLQP